MMVFTVWDICQDHNDPADWYVFKLGLWLDQPTILPPLLLQLPEQAANEGGHWGHCREIAWKETHLNAKVAFFTMMWQFKVFSHCIVEVYKWWTITILDREFDNSCQCSVWRAWSHRWWYASIASSNIYYHNKLGWARARNHRLSQLSNIPDKYTFNMECKSNKCNIACCVLFA